MRALVWEEEGMDISDEDSEEDSIGGYVPPTKAPDVRPCGPGEKGALVEMSTPDTMDRKGYPPGVVEGHQWERTTPPVTPERGAGGGGGGIRAPADTNASLSLPSSPMPRTPCIQVASRVPEAARHRHCLNRLNTCDECFRAAC